VIAVYSEIGDFANALLVSLQGSYCPVCISIGICIFTLNFLWLRMVLK